MIFGLPTNYLTIIRRKAKNEGYNPKMLFLADDGIHKAIMIDGEKHIKFGKLGMGDYELYKLLEKEGHLTKGDAIKHRNNYLKRSAGIRGDWESNNFSPNTLARKILW
jgi:hypothetical protein